MTAMQNLYAIYRKELAHYFVSPVAYILIGVFLIVAGFFFNIILASAIQSAFSAEMQSMRFGAPVGDRIRWNFAAGRFAARAGFAHLFVHGESIDRGCPDFRSQLGYLGDRRREKGRRLEGRSVRLSVASPALRRLYPRRGGHFRADLLLQLYFSMHVFDGAFARIDALAARLRANLLAA